MAITLATFQSYLLDSEILTQSEIDNFIEELAEDNLDAEKFARLLIKSGKLTKFQAQIISQGKGSSLNLGNYQILDKLGAGGMGQVYLARHKRMLREVAIKVLPPAFAKDKAMVDRFQREVQAAARLTHPNIVAAHDADEAKGTHFLVMEVVKGKDLSAHVKKHGPCSVEHAIDYIRQAAVGLQFAHDQGVVHRDIKPSNLLLEDSGVVKILDMGLARIDLGEDQAAGGLTQTGMVMGTIDYMAPEQAEDTKSADARSDVYSLGCSLFYLLCARAVFQESTIVRKILAHRANPIPSLKSIRSDVPDNLDQIYQKMVAKTSEERFQTMSEVVDVLADIHQFQGASGESLAEDSALNEFLVSQREDVFAPTPRDSSRPKSDTLVSGFLSETQISVGRGKSKSTPAITNKLKNPYLLGGAGVCLVVLIAFSLFSGKKNEPVKELDATPSPAVAALTPEQKPEMEPSHDPLALPQKGNGQNQNETTSPPKSNTPLPETLEYEMVGEYPSGPGFSTVSVADDNNTAAWYIDQTTVGVWDLKLGQKIHSIKTQGNLGASSRISRDGTLLVVNHDKGVEQFQLPSGKQISFYPHSNNRKAVFRGDSGPIAISPDGTRVATGGLDGRIFEFSASDGKLIREYKGHNGPLKALDYSNSGKLVSTVFFDTHEGSKKDPHGIRIWDVQTGEELWKFPTQTGNEISAAIFDPNSDTFYTARDQRRGLFTWGDDLKEDEWKQRLTVVRTMSVSRDGELLVTAGNEQRVTLFDTNTRQVLQTLPTKGYQWGVAISPDKTWILSNGVDGNNVRAWRRKGFSTAEDWIPLFNGKDLTGWKQIGNSKPGWSVNEDGELVAVGSDHMLVTDKNNFDNFELSLDFWLGDDANSGVYVRYPANEKLYDGYELQLGQPGSTGANKGNVTGSIWARAPYNGPTVGKNNAWVNLRAIVGGNRIQIFIDGTETVNYTDEEQTWNSGAIALQRHHAGPELKFRNIRIRELPAAGTPVVPAPSRPSVPVAAEWVDLLLNGSLQQFDQLGAGTWIVGYDPKAKLNVLATSEPGRGWIATKQTYREYELEFEYRLLADGNSGVFVRADSTGNVSGADFLEIQLLDDDHPKWKNAPAETKTGSFWKIKAPSPMPRTKAEEWHEMRIVVTKTEIKIDFEGKRINEISLNDPAVAAKIKATSGRVGFQSMGTPVGFRKIRIRELPAKPTEEKPSAQNSPPPAKYPSWLEPLFTSSDSSSLVTSFAMNESSQEAFAAREDGTIQVLDLNKGEVTRALEFKGVPHALDYSTISKNLLAGGERGQLMVWDTKNWNEELDHRLILRAGADGESDKTIRAVQFEKTGRGRKFAVTGDHQGINFLDPSQRKKEYLGFPLNAADGMVLHIATGNQSVAVGDNAARYHIYTVGSDPKHLSRFFQPINAVRFSHAVTTLAVADVRGHIQTINIQNGSTENTFSKIAPTVIALGWSPDDKLVLAIDQDSMLSVWDVNAKSDKPVQSVKLDAGKAQAAFVSEDGQYVLISGASGKVISWKINYQDPALR